MLHAMLLIFNFVGVPGGVVGGPCAYYCKINVVVSSLAECILVGASSCKQGGQRNARERELATFNDDRRAVGMLNSGRQI